MWPFRKREPEIRQQPFTDSVASALFAQASGTTTGDPTALGALEAAAGLYAAAAAAARVTPENAITAALTPACRALIFRDCIRRGESVHRLIAEGGAVRLLPAGSWDVRGGPDERSWWYRLDEFWTKRQLDSPCPERGRRACPLRDRRGSTLVRNLASRVGEGDRRACCGT